MNDPQILIELFRSNNPQAVIQKIKSLSYRDASKKIFEASEHPLVKAFLYNDKGSLPRSVADMRNGMLLQDSENIHGEFAWFVHTIKPYVKEINFFLSLQEDFQKFVLLDDFENAISILDRIESEIGYSFWSMENRFTLLEKWQGTEKNWDYLKAVTENIKVPYTLIFANFLSKKSEGDTVPLQYKRDLEIVVNNLTPEQAEYVVFKMGYFTARDYKAFSSMINMEYLSPIVDRYLFIVDILIELLGNKHEMELATNVTQDLIKCGITDFRLARILEFNTSHKLTIHSFNVEILELFELYSKGNYGEYIEKTPRFLKKNPLAIEVYEIYVKSLIELNVDFKPTHTSQTVDEILKSIFNLYSKNDEYFQSKDILMKSCMNFSKLPFFKQLLALCWMSTSSAYNPALEHHYFINSHSQNPQLILLNGLRDKISYPQRLIDRFLALRINYAIAKGRIELLQYKALPDLRVSLYKARIGYYYPLKTNEDFLIQLVNNVDITPYAKEEAIICLYKFYVDNKRWDKVSSLIVDAYFYNIHLIERLDLTFIVNQIVGSNYSLHSIDIDLPILFYIQDVDTYFMYSALEQYLETMNISKPSEIGDSLMDEKTIFLMDNICSVPVLNNFYLVYESDDDVIDERIKILKKLAEVDKVNSKQYLEEIASLLQKQKIHKTIKTVNDGKISLNFSRIRADKDYNLQSTFTRFIKLKKFSDKGELSLVEITELLKNYTADNALNQKPQEAGFIAFKSLFIEIVEQFLFSKEHGLDGDLSTRIRHGVLENQLRSVFSNNNLIATKGADNNYNDIQYWSALFEGNFLEEKIREEIHVLLKDFSKAVDSTISTIITDYIQIQSNRHLTKPSALFNYNYSEEFLIVMYNSFDSIVSYEEFLNEAFDLLSSHTEALLQNISDAFKNQINQTFQVALDTLQDKVKKILKSKGDSWIIINNRIHQAKTQIEAELYEVSNWFKISNYSIYSELDMETIVQTAIESINVINSYKIKPNFKSNITGSLTKGIYYIDIFKILLENCINHSLIDVDDLNIDISVLDDPEAEYKVAISTISIIISNNISETIDIATLNNKLTNIAENWNSDLSLVNNEKGSGFHKIKRLLKYDIEVDSSEINYKIDKNILSITIKFSFLNKSNEKDTIY